MSSPTPTRVLLLRHGEVASHRGDVPVTEDGLAFALATGRAIGAATDEPVAVLTSATTRSRQTAQALVDGIGDPSRVTGPTEAFALRNPDVYVAGVRVDMVSSPAAVAEQVPGMTDDQAAANAFFATFMHHDDRIGWWLGLDDVPGDTADTLADRIEAFARSVDDPGPLQGRLVVAVTHSPLLRAVLRRGTGSDPGEPPYVTGARLTVTGGHVEIEPYDPMAPATV